MKKLLAVLALLGIPAIALAVGDKQVLTLPVLDSGSAAFSAEDMSGPAQTNVFDISGLDYVQLFLSAAAVTGTANVTVDCYIGPGVADANYHVQSESISLGVATSSDYIPTHAVTTADKWPVVIPTQRASYMYCTFTCADGTMDLTAVGGNY